MPKIRVLDDLLINKIAAGEVVARPSSVVKELLENALDAGARRIEIEMEGGGLTLLRVADDGCGMTEEDGLLALQRHATSKIACEDDLADIRTMGFRGEALPSIASVCRLEIRTRPASSEGGTRIAVEGGKLQEVRPAAAVVGTSITIRDLFFNTPARRKFLRSEATESRHIIDTVADATLGHPEVSFKLSVPGKQPLLSSPGSGQLFDALVAVLGPATARAMLALGPRQHPELPYRVHGLVSGPEVHRATRTGLHLFVNRRPVQLHQLSRVIADAYHAYLPRGRWPVAVVFVEADPWTVDVNVHPQKLEVRLHQADRLAGLLGAAVRDALAGERRPESVTSLSPLDPSPAESGQTPESVSADGPRPFGGPASSFHGGFTRSRSAAPYLPLPGSVRDTLPPARAFPAEPGAAPFPAASSDPCSRRSQPMQTSLLALGDPAQGADWEHMSVLGQVFRTFVVGSSEGRVYFIDQHTAHERVLYERNIEQIRNRQVEIQQLLIPVTVECPRRAETELEETASLLGACGFDCQVHSGGTLVVKGIPVLERGIDVHAVMTELLEEAPGRGPLEDRLDQVAKTVSCKAAVKAGDRLSQPEMVALVRDLGKTRNPLRCPHGRPVLLQLGLGELKRLFERSW